MGWIAILAVAAAAATPGATPPVPVDQLWRSRPAVSFIEGDAIHLYGQLYDDMLEPLREQLRHAPVQLRQLRVASPGGDALVGLAVGELVRQYGLEVVVVPPGCGSACASYVFTGATRKVISPGAVVVWHNSCPSAALEDPRVVAAHLRRQLADGFGFMRGGDDAAGYPAHQIDAWAVQLADYARQMRTAHARFFAGTGIDGRGVCLEDHLDLPDVPADRFSYSYTLSVADMERMGICNVQAPADYTEQAARFFASRGRSADSGVVSLAGHPRFVPLHPPGYCAADAGGPAPRDRTGGVDAGP